jgi:phosphate transport system protein
MRHFEEELEDLRKRLLEMGSLVEAAIYHSVQALVEKDPQQAQLVMKNEVRINQMQMEIDEIATNLLALDQPVATDLRFITAAMKINTDLERMGDLAVNIAERASSLMDQKLVRPPVDIPHLANLVESMVRKALDAFVKRDTELARVVLASDDGVDALRDAIYGELIRFMERDLTVVRQSVDLLLVARNLERVADHATNIAEDVLFLVEGVDVRHHATRPVHSETP